MSGSVSKTERRRRQRTRLLANQGGRCAYCETQLDPSLATVDHVVPLSRGGLNVLGNKVAVCRPCNAAKSNLLPDDPEWLGGSKHYPAPSTDQPTSAAP